MDWGRFGERDNGSAEDWRAGRARRALSSAQWDGAVATAQLGSVAARQLLVVSYCCSAGWAW